MISKKDSVQREIFIEDKRDSDIMGTEPVHGLMLKMSIPLMFSMFVVALYNVVDSIFVSRINENALAALTLCFPFQSLKISVGIGTAVGMSALLSKYIGAKKYDKAEKVAHNGFILVMINYLFFFIIGCFARPIIAAQTADPQIIEYGTTYLQITQWFSFAAILQFMLERLLQATGKTGHILAMQASGAVFNIIMDPIMIFGLLGFPEMGVKGAAVATVCGQMLSCLIGIVLNIRINRELGLSLSKIIPHWQTIRDIYKLGIPVIVLQSMGAVMSFSINKILIGFSSTAVATFGVYFRLQNFVFMPIFGMNSASVPIIAYNYGARNRERVEKVISLCVRYGIIIMSVGTMIFWLIPEQLMSLFDASPEMTSLGVVALHIMSLNFPFAGFCIMRGAAFQALGKSVYSMNISLVRQFVVIPVAYIFAKIGGINMVWWAFPLAEIFGTSMSLVYSRRIRKQIISKL